jgi:hypothetical protein
MIYQIWLSISAVFVNLLQGRERSQSKTRSTSPFSLPKSSKNNVLRKYFHPIENNVSRHYNGTVPMIKKEVAHAP